MEKREIRERLRSKGLTEFQTEVLIRIMDIPKGETRSYKQVAAMVGRPGAYRAVGTAMKKNPMAPVIPCHRVVRSGGELGNYSAPGGTRRKRELLLKEGWKEEA